MAFHANELNSIVIRHNAVQALVIQCDILKVGTSFVCSDTDTIVKTDDLRVIHIAGRMQLISDQNSISAQMVRVAGTDGHISDRTGIIIKENNTHSTRVAHTSVDGDIFKIIAEAYIGSFSIHKADNRTLLAEFKTFCVVFQFKNGLFPALAQESHIAGGLKAAGCVMIHVVFQILQTIGDRIRKEVGSVRKIDSRKNRSVYHRIQYQNPTIFPPTSSFTNARSLGSILQNFILKAHIIHKTLEQGIQKVAKFFAAILYTRIIQAIGRFCNIQDSFAAIRKHRIFKKNHRFLPPKYLSEYLT